MATIPPNDPRAPKTVRHETVTETVPASQVVVEKRTVERRSNTGAWIVGVSLLVLVFVLGYFMTANDAPEPNVTSVTVNNPPTSRATATDTRVVTTEEAPPADVDVFVESAERDIVVLSQPDNAENQAEIAAIRQRMEDLRRADAASAAAIRAEVEASMARLRAAAPAASGSEPVATTTTTTTGASTAPVADPATTAGVDAETLESLQKRVDDASTMVGQLQNTAAPTAAQQVTGLQEQLAKIQGDMAKLTAASGQEQMDMLTSLEAEVASLEEGVKAVPIQ